jgi:hypothetical protein
MDGFVATKPTNGSITLSTQIENRAATYNHREQLIFSSTTREEITWQFSLARPLPISPLQR